MRYSFEFANVLGAVYHKGTLKFTPDGSSVFSPVGNKIVVYDLKANKTYALPTQAHYNLEHIAIHPSMTFALLATEKSHLMVTSLQSGKVLHFKDYKAFPKINHLSFSPDGNFYCVCGSNLALVYITSGAIVKGKGRELSPFKIQRKLRINYDTITSVSWSLNSQYLCIGSQDATITVVNLLDKVRPHVHLGGHSDVILGCFFANTHQQDMDIYSISRNCQVVVWGLKENEEEQPPLKKQDVRLWYHLVSKKPLRIHDQRNCIITSADYNTKAKLLVLGYNTGHYRLFEMPNIQIIHEFHQDFGSIDSISINPNGDWIALGSSVEPEYDSKKASNNTETKLIVWEWQSKSHILERRGSGISMNYLHECVDYSPDGSSIVSGVNEQLKLWDCITGETLAEFGSEHTASIRAVKFVPNKSGKVVVSASLDGTIRAYDLQKLKNFRTFTSNIDDRRPKFICMDVDFTGEFIAAGTYNYFEVYLFSLKTGKSLEQLAGHEGLVSGVAFSPTSNMLVSGSWDKTVRIWNLFDDSKVTRDVITLNKDVMTVAFRPDGNQFAVSLSNGQIAFFNPFNSEEFGAPIEGSNDLGITQLTNEVSRDKRKYFLSMNYSVDGNHLLAAGKSNFICLYNVNQKVLVKKISMTFNRSMDGLFDYISKRRKAELGFDLEMLDSRSDKSKPVSLPGVKKGDYGERQVKPIIAAFMVSFCPTMRSFVAATSEGVLIFSLDVNKNFNPHKLAFDITPATVLDELSKKLYASALIKAVMLNEQNLIVQVFETVPLDHMDPTIAGLDVECSYKLLEFIAKKFLNTSHLEYYLTWARKILYKKGFEMKAAHLSPRYLHQVITSVYGNLKKNCEYCRNSLKLLSEAKHPDELESESELQNMDIS